MKKQKTCLGIKVAEIGSLRNGKFGICGPLLKKQGPAYGMRRVADTTGLAYMRCG
jgi:hypothetical protein